MIYKTKTFRLKDGREAVFCSPSAANAVEMLHYLKKTSEETQFLLREPEECNLTIAQEEAFLLNLAESPSAVMINCTVGEKIAGNCQLRFHTMLKTRHRAEIGIAILKDYWGLGIGTFMFEEMIRIAKERGIQQLELEVFEGNERAMCLYRKMGFEVVAAKPDAIRLKDGTLMKELFMVKRI